MEAGQGDPLYALLGMLVGFLIGLTGLGGGSLMTPALIFTGVEPLLAVGTDLVFATITRILGVAVHGRHGRVRVDIAWRLLAGSIPAVLLGGLLLRYIPKDLLNELLTPLIGTVLVATAGLAILREELRLPVRPRKVYAYPVGFIVGLTVQFTSIGAGVVVSFALLNVARIDPREAIGTVLLYGVSLTALSSLNYISLGLVDWGLSALLVLGGLVGVLTGSALALRMPRDRLKLVVNVVILVIGLLTLAHAA
ncbi:MAG: sulfite exporter TauE/SafE family protein [Desulfurococcales archaeon]|nr:sulfite exporter TauE/SafE family protein [Desulfurococcales archaeon]